MSPTKKKRPVSLAPIRRALADLLWASGCGCCSDKDAYKKAEAALAKLLRVPAYPDNSGYDFGRYRPHD